jgi:DNA-binding response OmpR family regulator
MLEGESRMKTSPHILCIDDDEDTCSMLTTFLGMSDLKATGVHDANEALRLIEEEKFDLYIIDRQLPGVSGLTLCEQIRAIDKDTPIVIYSGEGYQSQIDAGLRAGANAYLVKPNIEAIVPTIKRLLEEP